MCACSCSAHLVTGVSATGFGMKDVCAAYSGSKMGVCGLTCGDWLSADVVAFLGVLSTTIVAFNQVNPLAATLLVPQALWVAFATYLTFGLCELNPKVRPKSPLAHAASLACMSVAADWQPLRLLLVQVADGFSS